MADEDDDDDGGVEMQYSAANIDIDAIASAKSLGDAMRLLAPQLEGLPRRSRGKYGKRKHLTPEEKAELTRRRNRENARSTRQRRKMYIQHLQEVAEKLKKRHDELNAKMATPPPDGYSQQREAARRFFQMRGDCITNSEQWLEILSPNAILTLPSTPYRSFPQSELCQRTRIRHILGPQAIASDCSSLHDLLAHIARCRMRASSEQSRQTKSFSPATSSWTPSSAVDNNDSTQHKRQKTIDNDIHTENDQEQHVLPTLSFQVDQGSIVHASDLYLCQWTARLTTVEDNDIQISVSHSGMAKIAFSHQNNTIDSVDLRFDVTALSSLLQDFSTQRAPSLSAL